MKLLCLPRIWMPVLVAGAALCLAPQSRAQAEVAPDHFDGTDSWEIAVKSKAPAPRAKQAATASALSAANQKPSSHLTAGNSSKDLSQVQQPQVVAVQDKHKVPANKSKNR